jgi:hypothetical protein
MIEKTFIILSCLFFLIITASYTFAASVELAWDPPADGGDVVGYKVSWRTDTGSYNDTNSETVTGKTSETISGLDEDEKYYFKVNAYNCAGLGSDSNEISWSSPISNITYTLTSTSVTINGSNTADVSQVRLYVNNLLNKDITPSGTSWSYTYSANGSLPDETIFELKIIDAGGNERSTGIIYIYNAANLFHVLTKTIQNARIGDLYSLSMQADVAHVTWNLVSGNLPDGLSFENGIISGTPDTGTEDNYQFTVSATNLSGLRIESAFSLTVDTSGTTGITIADAVNGTPVSVSSSVGTIADLQGQDPSVLSPPSGYEFTYGLFKFRITGLSGGGSSTITFNYQNTIPSGVVWYWYDTETDGWRDISRDVNLNVNGSQIQITLTDGGVGDSDEVSGLITDPSGPAFLSTTDTKSGGGGGGGCFIATAAFGSPFEAHVKILRKFRDVYLMPTSVGRGFVSLYYEYSPALADVIRKHNSMRAMVRWGLAPAVGMAYVTLNTSMAEKVGIMVILMIVMTGCFVWMRRRPRVLS